MAWRLAAVAKATGGGGSGGGAGQGRAGRPRRGGAGGTRGFLSSLPAGSLRSCWVACSRP